ncbi:hypothetical protein ACFQ1I_11365 [Kitasatospora arboriphila]
MSEAWLVRPSAASAQSPAKTTPAAAASPTSEAAITDQSRRAAGPAPANSSSATSARWAATEAPSPRAVSGWKTGGTTRRTSVPEPVDSSSGARVGRSEASAARAAVNGGRSLTSPGSGTTGSRKAPGTASPAAASTATPRTSPAPNRAASAAVAPAADPVPRAVPPSTTVPSPRTVSTPGPPGAIRRPNRASADGWSSRRKAVSDPAA